jgi:hypothetical protein
LSKKDYSLAPARSPTVALAMDVNVHCDRTFDWFLATAQPPNSAQLYVLHIVSKRSDKPDARRFLASLKPRCIESKKLYAMASALVSYDKPTADSILKFSHDRRVDTLIIASKGEPSRLRLKTSITDECLRHSSTDVLIWQDDQTRNVSKSMIKKFEGHALPQIPLSTWEKPEQVSTPPKKDFQEEKTIPQPPFPRPRGASKEKAPPMLDDEDNHESSFATPPSVVSSRKKNPRKNSLKYYMYDSIAKGKQQLSRLVPGEKERPEAINSNWGDIYLEPLSP